MGKSDIPEIMLSCGAVQFSANDTIPVVVSFSVLGGIRDAFNEENWTKAYDKNDNTFKMKYGIKIHSGGIKKRVVGQVDTYRKASIFWTRNPKLTNPMKDKRVWVQVAKNFTPHIKLSMEEETFTIVVMPIKLRGATGSPVRAMALWGFDAPYKS